MSRGILRVHAVAHLPAPDGPSHSYRSIHCVLCFIRGEIIVVVVHIHYTIVEYSRWIFFSFLLFFDMFFFGFLFFFLLRIQSELRSGPRMIWNDIVYSRLFCCCSAFIFYLASLLRAVGVRKIDSKFMCETKRKKAARHRYGFIYSLYFSPRFAFAVSLSHIIEL